MPWHRTWYHGGAVHLPVGCAILLLAVVHGLTWQELQHGWHESESETYFLIFLLAMTNLRCISFSLDYCNLGTVCVTRPEGVLSCGINSGDPAAKQQVSSACDVLSKVTNVLLRSSGHASMTRLVSPMLAAAQSSTLFWFLLFIFYLPPLPNGPIVCFSDFVAQVKMPNQRRDQDGLAWAVRRMSRLVCWWLLAETMLHVLHSSAFLHHTQLLQSLSPAVLGGIALAQVSFFYVKYLVLFGLPSLVMCLDGLKPPPLPRCVTLTYSFTAIWRTFDTGLHQWLVRYIYLPLGGSQTGTLRLLLASAATFAFVAAWHGGQKDLLLWAGVNWLGVLMEYGVRSLCSKPCVKSWLSAALHPLSLRRATGLLTAVATIITIWSNLIFFAGTHVGEIYFKMFLAGWHITLNAFLQEENLIYL
uniref:Hedgehog acyltransferase n=1 Tax=Eptatretus burgeri TaxID=7764 RepID=A0A8C4R1D0_EPTBU